MICYYYVHKDDDLNIIVVDAILFLLILIHIPFQLSLVLTKIYQQLNMVLKHAAGSAATLRVTAAGSLQAHCSTMTLIDCGQTLGFRKL